MKRKRHFYNVAERNGVLDCCREMDKLAGRLADRHRDSGTREFLAGISGLVAAVTDAYSRDLPISFYSSTQYELPDFAADDDDYAVVE